MLADLLSARRSCAALAVLCAACGASPPPQRPGQLPPVGVGNYASIAHCTPCGGASCGNEAVGAPDGNTVDLRTCGTLDVAFTGGELIARIGEPDLALIVVPPVDGSVRVEASTEGEDYVIVGFAGAMPVDAWPPCEATLEGTRLLVDLDNCNTISNVSFLRLIYGSQGGSGSMLIDALEALSFKPR